MGQKKQGPEKNPYPMFPNNIFSPFRITLTKSQKEAALHGHVISRNHACKALMHIKGFTPYTLFCVLFTSVSVFAIYNEELLLENVMENIPKTI